MLTLNFDCLSGGALDIGRNDTVTRFSSGSDQRTINAGEDNRDQKRRDEYDYQLEQI